MASPTRSLQWRERTSKGVSKWLFIGQITASIGFSIYSILLHNWVFTITNLLMAASAAEFSSQYWTGS